MNTLLDAASVVLIMGGGFFFFAGTVGLLRFRSVYMRLHALTKADNMGLGLTIAGLVLHTASVSEAVTLVLIWLLILVSSATACYLLADVAFHRDESK